MYVVEIWIAGNFVRSYDCLAPSSLEACNKIETLHSEKITRQYRDRVTGICLINYQVRVK